MLSLLALHIGKIKNGLEKEMNGKGTSLKLKGTKGFKI